MFLLLTGGKIRIFNLRQKLRKWRHVSKIVQSLFHCPKFWMPFLLHRVFLVSLHPHRCPLWVQICRSSYRYFQQRTWRTWPDWHEIHLGFSTVQRIDRKSSFNLELAFSSSSLDGRIDDLMNGHLMSWRILTKRSCGLLKVRRHCTSTRMSSLSFPNKFGSNNLRILCTIGFFFFEAFWLNKKLLKHVTNCSRASSDSEISLKQFIQKLSHAVFLSWRYDATGVVDWLALAWLVIFDKTHKLFSNWSEVSLNIDTSIVDKVEPQSIDDKGKDG